MRPFTQSATLSILVIGLACSANEEAPSTPPGPPLAALFTDPAMPHCDGGIGTQFRLKGQLDGQTIDVGTSVVSNIDATGFQVLSVVGGTVRTDLALTWNPPLAEDAALALTGASIIIPDGQPSGGQSFCITAGKFGSRSLSAGAAGRELLFQITGAKSGDCNGAATPIKLNGCIFRTNTYFPVPIPPDAGLHFTSDAAPPAIDQSTPLTDLTYAQMVALCDWEAASMGGYGTVTDCMGEGLGTTVKNYDDAAQCIHVHFDTACSFVTVADWEACINAVVPKRGCVVMDACDRISGHCASRDL